MENFNLERDANFSWPVSILDKWAEKQPNNVAIWWISHDCSTEIKLTYSDVSRRSHRAALALENLGIRKGDRVLVQLPRVVEWWEIIFGLQRLGAIPIPGTSLLVKKDIEYRARVSNAKAFIGDKVALDHARSIDLPNFKIKVQVSTPENVTIDNKYLAWHDVVDKVPLGTLWKGEPADPKDIILIYFTSGTTGYPKMVALDSDYLLGHTITGKFWYKLAPGKVFLNMADLGWAKAAYSTYGSFNVGSTLLIQDVKGAFNSKALIELLKKYPITNLCVPPTIYRSLVTSESMEYFKKFRPRSLEHCVSAGEALNAEVIKQWKDIHNIVIREGYGQTETVTVAGNFEESEVQPGSFGRAAPGFSIEVLDENGKILEPGNEGDICIRTDKGLGSKFILRGYINSDGAVTQKEIKSPDGKTWYITGDRAVKDSNGYFWFVGRSDDVINSSGYRIGPFEVESTLKEHPAVLESAAVGSPDPARGEIVKGFIILSQEYKNHPDKKKLITEIQDHCKKVSSPYKYPREIEFVDTLPKTISGKIRRIELRQLEVQRKKKSKL